MENLELSWRLQEIADLMELNNDSIHKIRAYRRAARSITGLSRSVRAIADTGDLRQIPGVGASLEEKILEWLSSGTIDEIARLKSAIPPGVLEFTRISGIGKNLARRLHDELGVGSLDELEAAARSRQIRAMRGLGSKTEMMILRELDRMRRTEGMFPIGMAMPLIGELEGCLKSMPGVSRVTLVGDARRWCSLVGEVEWIISGPHARETLGLLDKLPPVRQVIDCSGASARLVLTSDLEARVTAVDDAVYPICVVERTGSKAHLSRLREFASAQGWELRSDALIEPQGSRKQPAAERDVYAMLGLAYIEPQLREDRGEVAAAAAGRLPPLLEFADIRGDLHVHTTYSDGVHSVAEMAEAAQGFGWDFVAVCDHSRSLTVARGLTAERLQSQAREIDSVAASMGFSILKGIECDILADGSLDFDDCVLEALDIVVASIHTGFRQDEHTLTNRLVQAAKNPHVNIIGHPTGQLLGYRQPYPVDMETVIQAAADYGKALELNASPERLDLNETYAAAAVEQGVPISINTDAHSAAQLEYMRLGVSYGKRAWLTKESVLNAWSLDRLRRFCNS